MKQLLVTLQVDPSSLSAGDHSGAVIIETTSKYRPQLRIPVDSSVQHEVTMSPALVDMSASLQNSQPPPVTVIFSHKHGNPIELAVRNIPEGFLAEVDDGVSPPRLTISARDYSRSISGRVILAAKSGNTEEILELACFYFAAAQ